MHEAEYTDVVLWDNPESWNGEGDGRGFRIGVTHVYLWLLHADVWQRP